MVKKLLLILDLRNFLICDILKKKPEGGTTDLNLEKSPISAKGGTYPLGMRNRSNFAKLKFSEIKGGCIIRIPGFKRYGFF